MEETDYTVKQLYFVWQKNEYKFPKKFRKPARNTDMVYGPSDSELSLYLEGISSVGALLPLYPLL